jgi:hypothetical protein
MGAGAKGNETAVTTDGPTTQHRREAIDIPWFKVDDGFHGHPKVMDLSVEAVGLWTLAGSWCAKYLTDGFVPEKTVRRLGGGPDLAGELYAAGLWEASNGGWQFKDWTDYQPSKAEVEAERQAARDRMKKVRAAKKGVTKEHPGSAELPANNERSSEEVRIAPSQSHPVPTSSSTKKREPATRGSRLHIDWRPSQETVDKIQTECPGVDYRREHATFVDYWIAQPGAKGVKLDWEATWRNWMRRKHGDTTRGGAPKVSKAAQNAAEYRRLFGDEPARGISALDPGVSP